jgi:hypothetical protein
MLGINGVLARLSPVMASIKKIIAAREKKKQVTTLNIFFGVQEQRATDALGQNTQNKLFGVGFSRSFFNWQK